MLTILSSWRNQPISAQVLLEERLTVFAIQEVTDRTLSGRIQVTICLTFASRALGGGLLFIIRAAFRTAVRKARLAGFQFKLLSTNGASFDGKSHEFNDT